MVGARGPRHAGVMTKKTPTHEHGLDGLYDGLRRPGIMRGSDDKWFAGVCTGVARWLGVDPLVVRGAFILFAIFFGMGIALYLVLWLLMPTERGDIALERALKFGDGGAIFLLVVTAISVFGGGPWFGNGESRGFRFGGFVVMAALAWWFLTRTDSGRNLVRSSPWGRRTDDAGAPAATTADPAFGPTGAPAPAPGTVGASTIGLSTGNAAAAAGAAVGQPPSPGPAPTPSRPRVHVRTIGFAATLVVLGLALGAGALVASLAEGAAWPGNHLAVGVATGLGVIGLATIIGGLAGRRSGVLAPISVVAIVFVALTSLAPAGVTRPWDLGERRVAVTTLTGDDRYQLGVGELTVDLRQSNFATTTTKPDAVSVSLGVGELNLYVPPGTSVVVNVKGRAGEVSVRPTPGSATVTGNGSSSGPSHESGVNWERTFTVGTGQPELVVDAQVGLGEITIFTGATS